MNALTNPPGAPPMLVDRLEAARLLSVSPGTVDNLKNRGELASVKLGARRLYHVDDLAALIAKKREVLS
jgi:excisionase family DNA binding protein